MKSEILRKLEKPYFLLRTHDRVGHFMQHQMDRMFFKGKNGLGAFLPPAKLVEVDGIKSVKYSLTKIQAKTLRPLKFIPLPELKSFQRAAEDFFSPKADLTKYETDLRQSFKLPDPELEPESYFLWGTKRNPKLLVLWGVEKVPGSSLPLVGQSQSAESVYSKLSQKVVRRTKEWLGTTLACSVLGILSMVFVLTEDTSPPEIASVTAINDASTVKVVFNEAVNFMELGVESFRLRNTAYVLTPNEVPDEPNAVSLSLNQPLEERKDYCLDFGLFQRPMDLAGNPVGEAEILESERVRYFRFEDQCAPLITEIEPLPPSSLIVRVNEPVSLRSVLRPSTFRLSNFALVDSRIDEESHGREITLEFDETLVNNGSYVLEVNGLEDDSEYRNQLNEKFEFRYVDSFGPDLVKTIQGRNQSEIILHFDECLEPISSLNIANYQIDGGAQILHVVPYKPYQDAQWGDGAFSAVRLVTTPLIPLQQYLVEVSSIGDRMDPVNLSSTLKVEYSFSGNPDRSPPFVVKAKGAGNELNVDFSEILEHAKLKKSDLKLLDLRTNRQIEVGSIDLEVVDDFSRATFKLASQQFPGRVYGIYIENCSDSSGNAAHLEHTFKARGIFREPIPLKVEGNTFAGESVINFSLPNGVKWDRSAASKIEAYGVSIQDSEALEVEDLDYELTDQGAFIKLNLKNPIDSGNYEFYLEGVMLVDGSVVDRPYHARIRVGS